MTLILLLLCALDALVLSSVEEVKRRDRIRKQPKYYWESQFCERDQNEYRVRDEFQ